MNTANTLTNREWEVLELVAQGNRNSKIAEVLFISNNTVEQHLKKIYNKLEVENRVAASKWYWANSTLLTTK